MHLKILLILYLHFLGYAIIQLPELILFLHRRLMGIKCNGPLEKEGPTHLKLKRPTAKISADKNKNVEKKNKGLGDEVIG